MTWRLARSLETLRAEVRAGHPGTRVDTIGDQSHVSGASDHNPNGADVVCAADFFPNAGLDLNRFAAAVVASRHPALKYVIYNRRIWSAARAGEGWRPYSGKNPHTGHVHVSVGTGPDGRSVGPYDNTSPWGIEENDDMDAAQFAKLLDDPAVAARLRRLPWQYQDAGQPSAHGIVFGEMRTNLAALRGADWVNEQQIIDGVLTGLGQQDLDVAATALRAAFGDRVGELAALLAAPESQARG